jgi:hypothetical protein
MFILNHNFPLGFSLTVTALASLATRTRETGYVLLFDFPARLIIMTSQYTRWSHLLDRLIRMSIRLSHSERCSWRRFKVGPSVRFRWCKPFLNDNLFFSLLK